MRPTTVAEKNNNNEIYARPLMAGPPLQKAKALQPAGSRRRATFARLAFCALLFREQVTKGDPAHHTYQKNFERHV